MPNALPSVTGKQLIRLFRRDGWQVVRRVNHGISFSRFDDSGVKRITVIPDKRAPLTDGTLGAILGMKQSNVGRVGLADMIERHGLS